MKKTLATLEDLRAEAADFARGLRPRADAGAAGTVSGATLVTLSGDLGAGKTAFTQGLASALGVEDTVTSPTFVLEKIYALPEATAEGGEGGGAFKRLIHIDAYRLEGGAELAPLGFDELMKDAGTLVMLEWPEKVADALPPATHHLSIEALAGGSRDITYA